MVTIIITIIVIIQIIITQQQKNKVRIDTSLHGVVVGGSGGTGIVIDNF